MNVNRLGPDQFTQMPNGDLAATFASFAADQVTEGRSSTTRGEKVFSGVNGGLLALLSEEELCVPPIRAEATPEAYVASVGQCAREVARRLLDRYPSESGGV
jgi:hypothetical protein